MSGWRLMLVYLWLGVLSGMLWLRLAHVEALTEWHAAMLGGEALAPGQYRLLVPWLAELLRIVLPPLEMRYIYCALRSLITAAVLFGLDRYLRTWFAPGAAAAGAICLAAALPFTYAPIIAESDPLNLLVMILAFIAIERRRFPLLLVLVLVGTLNRETTVLVPAVYALARWGEVPRDRLVVRTVLLLGAWGLVFFAVRFAVGHEGQSPLVKAPLNVSSWLPTAIVLMVFGPLWALAAAGRRRAPTMLTRAFWLILPYLALHYVVAEVWEVRLFLPLAPIVIPLAWHALFPGDVSEPRGGGAR